jgi:hypothetical protein
MKDRLAKVDYTNYNLSAAGGYKMYNTKLLIFNVNF